jgi:predicted permease
MEAFLRLGFKQVTRNPGFALTAIISMASGIALNALMFAVVDALRNPIVPFSRADNLFTLEYLSQGRQDPATTFRILSAGARSLEGIAGFSTANRVVGTVAGNEVRTVTTVDHNFFSVLGSAPAVGRLTLSVDEVRVGTALAVVSKQFAERLRTDGEQGLPGSVTVDGVSHPVIGVAVTRGGIPTVSDVWLLDPTSNGTAGYYVARSRSAFDDKAVRKALEPVRRALDEVYSIDDGSGWFMEPVVRNRYRTPGFVLAVSAAVFALLLVAAANLSSLYLTKILRQKRDFAIRSALGASPLQVGLAAFAQIAVLSFIGLALGLLLCRWGLELLRTYMPPTGEYLPLAELRVNWRVLGAGCLVTAMAGVLVAVIPVYYAATKGTEASSGLIGTHVAGVDRALKRFFFGLIALETSVSLALAVSSGVLLASARRLSEIDLGFDPSYVVTAEVRLPQSLSSAQRFEALRTIHSEVARLPGVREVALLRLGALDDRSFSVTSADGTVRTRRMTEFSFQATTPNALRALGIPVLKGRDFDDADAVAPGAVIVDETMAQWMWPDQDPIGRSIKFGGPASRRPWHTVVGVSKSAMLRRQDVTLGPSPTIFVASHPFSQTVGASTLRARLMVRSTFSNATVVSALQRLSLLPNQGATLASPQELTTYTGYQRIKDSHRFVSLLFSGFAASSLLLAALGIYGVVSFVVESSMKEWGVRLALGSPRRQIVQSVVLVGLRPTIAGMAAGLLVSLWSTTLLSRYLYSVADVDGWSYHFGMVAVGLAALVACAQPARRALQGGIGELLRVE